jgi:hypothetical protein
MELARVVQGEFGDKITKFSAFNDAYHQKNSPESGHTRGLKFDFGLKNPSEASEIGSKIESLGKISGARIKVMDEYSGPSKKATGGHVDVGFKDANDANIFSTFINQNAGKTPQENRTTDLGEVYPDAKSATGGTITTAELPEAAAPIEPPPSSPTASVPPSSSVETATSPTPVVTAPVTTTTPMTMPEKPSPVSESSNSDMGSSNGTSVSSSVADKPDLTPMTETYLSVGNKAEKQRDELLQVNLKTNSLLEQAINVMMTNQTNKQSQPTTGGATTQSNPKKIDSVINLGRAY